MRILNYIKCIDYLVLVAVFIINTRVYMSYFYNIYSALV